MKAEEAAQVLSMLTAGFHRESLEQDTIELWIDVLEPLDAEIATRIALDWVKNQDRFPSISQFRHAHHLARRRSEQELSAAHGQAGLDDLSKGNLPQWVSRWFRRYAYNMSLAEGDSRRRVLEQGDWRVFPEQIGGEGLRDGDPRFSTAEAHALGVMPDDAWLTDEYRPG